MNSELVQEKPTQVMTVRNLLSHTSTFSPIYKEEQSDHSNEKLQKSDKTVLKLYNTFKLERE